MEVESAVDALVSTFFLLSGARADKTKGPPLELIWLASCECLGIRQSCGLTYNLQFDRVSEVVLEPFLDNDNGRLGDIDSYPFSIELLRGGDSRTAAAERIEYRVAVICREADDALQ